MVMEWPSQAASTWSGPGGAWSVYEMIDDHGLMAGSDGEPWQSAHRYWLPQRRMSWSHRPRTCSRTCQHADRPDTLLLDSTIPGTGRRPSVRSPPIYARTSPGRLAGGQPSGSPPLQPPACRVVIGYYGSIASWFDMELWEEARPAAARLGLRCDRPSLRPRRLAARRADEAGTPTSPTLTPSHPPATAGLPGDFSAWRRSRSC